MNKSGLRPLGRAVLLEPYEPEYQKTRIVIPENYRKLGMMLEERGIVVGIGTECWVDEKEPRARIGDKVIVSKWAGTAITGPLDGKLYRMVNADDVYCGIDHELEAAKEVA